MQDAMKIVRVEQALLRFFSTACQSSSTQEMMDGYLKMTDLRTMKRISRFTTAVQLVSYGVVGIVVIAVYQVLMLPMQMLGAL